jgi:hypothetical protein
VTWLDWALSAVFAALLYVVFVQQLTPVPRAVTTRRSEKNADPGELLLITGQRQAEHPTFGAR